VAPVLLATAALACLGVSVLLSRSTGRGDRPAAAAIARPSHGTAGPAPSAGGPTGGFVGYLGRHRWARRALGAAAVVMVLGAGVAAGYPFLTDRYTEHLQSRLEKQLESPETRIAYRSRTIPVGDSLTRIRIPKLGVDTVVVEGTTQSALRAGAGHYVDSPLPCEGGNVAIAGHRVTYGKPFTDLEKLEIGDEIHLDTPIGGCTYRVTTAPFPVDPTDLSVVGPTKDPELTLTTCHPEHSARQRLVVHARRVATHQEPAT
jgi:sortase A